ncbi:hypothetical protein RAA17_14570 [Komagataeibacter rhaeticus]|nr:hypothetical protein [Komagataeibacter rhaeticus]
MFRSDAIDRAVPALAAASARTSAMLTQLLGTMPGPQGARTRAGMRAAQWGRVHGLAVLAIDGMLDALLAAEGKTCRLMRWWRMRCARHHGYRQKLAGAQKGGACPAPQRGREGPDPVRDTGAQSCPARLKAAAWWLPVHAGFLFDLFGRLRSARSSP